MRFRLAPFALVLALLLAATPGLARERGQDDLRRDMEFARLTVYPALVNISVVSRDYSGGRSLRFPSSGSGVIVSPAGHVVTNFHVAGDATRIECRLPSRETIEAEVVAHDPLTDLSVLRLKLETRKNKNQPIPFARIGDSDGIETGDYVLAMGNPLTLSSSMTLGIVSNPKRVFASFTGAEMDELDLGSGQKTGIFTRWIQHDALILPGNSGGPLVNLRGDVIGINELGGGGVGFAIPANIVSHVLNQALTHGEVIRGWLGVTLYPVERMGRETGVLVASVQPGGPAMEAGISPGDILLSVGGSSTDAMFFEEVPLIYKSFADLAPGRKLSASFLRGDEVKQTEITVTRMEAYLGDEREVRPVGLTLRDITGPMALIRRYPSSDGLLVSGTRPGFPAMEAKPRVLPGDVIVGFNRQPLKDFAQFRELLDGVEDKKSVLLELRRGDEQIVTVLDLSEKPAPFAGGELPKAWVGLQTQVLTPDVAKALGLGQTRGFRVTQVYPTTEAEKAGLRVGDVITALNGDPLAAFRVQDAELFERRVENLTIGENATLTVLREGGQKEIAVLLQETPRSSMEAKTAKDEVMEYQVRNITFLDTIRNRWPQDQTGVIVTDVTMGGWASMSGLRGGDLIRQINGKTIGSVAEFEKVVKWLSDEKVSPVAIFVVRDYHTAFVFASPEYGGDR